MQKEQFLKDDIRWMRLQVKENSCQKNKLELENKTLKQDMEEVRHYYKSIFYKIWYKS
jgi:hypothetical protein